MNKRSAILGFGLMIFSAIFFAQPATALSYQNTVGLEFTFDPLLAVTLSSDILLIDDLAPGNTASSNTITITVNTTGITGYTLSAAVGNGTTYTDNNLTNLASPASPKPAFTSIPVSSTAVASLTTDNTWAYTLDSTNYYGLAYLHSVNNNDETWTVLNATKDVSGTAATSGCVGTCAGTATTNFTISARAAATQPSGDYTNVIQFKVISNPVPSTYSITYDQNTTDTVTNMPTNVATTNTTDSTVTLSSNTPTRAGYTFGGWCTEQPAYNGSCNGDTYDPGDDMPITVGSANTITLYAIWPVYAIIYMPNASDVIGDMSSIGTTSDLTAVSTQAGIQSKVTPSSNSSSNINNSTTSVELIAPNFKRAGYGFAGWSTDFTATSSSTIYGPNETINTDTANGGVDLEGGLILYPVWIASAGNLQGWTGCSSLTPVSYNSTTGALTATLSSVTALTDTRDNNVYAVAKLADGQCWMIENLKLNAEDSRGTSNIAKAQGYGSSTTYGNFVGLANSEDANFNTTNPTSNNAANSLYSSDGTTTVNIGTTDSPARRIPRYNNNNTNMATNATNSDGTTTLEDKYNIYSDATKDNHLRWYGYGNYYNWPAAMANTIHFDTYGGTSGSDAAGTSLCPTGWHLPLGGASTGTLANGVIDSTNRVGGFSYLDRKMGGTGASSSINSITSATMATYWRKFPNNFVLSGVWYSAQPYNRGDSGRYWSSSADSDSDYKAYCLRLYNSSVNPGTDVHDKYLGYSVRCVAN